MIASELTRTLGDMAAIARMVESGIMQAARPIPIRYWGARRVVSEEPHARTLTWEEAKDLGLA